MTKILILEPDIVLREALVKVLLDAGLEVHEGTTGIQGVDMIRRESPDVVLMALSLPEGCGRFVMMQVNEMEKPPALVVLTVETNPVLPPCAALRSILRKPAQPDAILMAVFEAAMGR